MINAEMTFYGLGDWQWYVWAVYSAMLALTTLFVPGYFCTRFTKLSLFTKFFLSFIIGVVLLGWVSFWAGIFGIYTGVYWYFGCCAVASCWYLWCHWQAIWSACKRLVTSEKNLWLLIIAGLVLQLPAVFSSGLATRSGVDFYFTNNGDGLMHIGFIESMTHQFPPLRPEIDTPLTNYHYWSDLVMAQFVRLGVPAINLFFQYVPILLSIVTTGLVYQAMRETTHSRSAAFWTTLVFLLAGDGSYWLRPFFPLNRGREMATLDNGADFFLNMPYCFAKAIFVGSWLVLQDYWRRYRQETLLMLVVMLVALPLFKVYWWLLFISGWGVTLIWRLAKSLSKKCDHKKRLDVQEWLAFLVVGAGGWALLQTVMTSGGQSLVLAPLMWPKILISHDHLAWDEWFLRQDALAGTGNWRLWWDGWRLVVVAIIYVFGARLAGFALSKKSIRLLQVKNALFFLVPAVFWTIVGFNVAQSAGGQNSFNFLVIAAVALLFPLGCVLAGWWEGRSTRWLVVATMIALVPRTVDNWQSYLQAAWDRGQMSVKHYTSARLSLLGQLHAQTRWTDVVLVYPENQDLRVASVIPALAGRKTFLSNQAILETHSLELEEREQQVRDVFAAQDAYDLLARARRLGIAAIYLESYELNGLPFSWPAEAVAASSEAGLVVRVPSVSGVEF